MPKLVVTLIRPHRHGGRDYLPGATLELTAEQAQWLVGQQRARLEQPGAKPVTPGKNPAKPKE